MAGARSGQGAGSLLQCSSRGSSQVVDAGCGAEFFLQTEGAGVRCEFRNHGVRVIEVPEVTGVADTGLAACGFLPALKAVGAERTLAHSSHRGGELARPLPLFGPVVWDDDFFRSLHL